MPHITKPVDLYLYLSILRPDIFDSYPEFVTRYCKASLQDTKSLFLNDKGFSKTKELNLLIYEKVRVSNSHSLL